MSSYSFRVIWSDEDDAYIATIPEFAGVSAFGESADAALHEAHCALESAREAYREEGWDLPEPRRLQSFSGQFRLRLPKTLHAQLAEQAEIEGVSLNSLAIAILARGLGVRTAAPPNGRSPTRSGTRP